MSIFGPAATEFPRLVSGLPQAEAVVVYRHTAEVFRAVFLIELQ